ncbi:MAG: 4Fe-4S binding protein [Candidatus Bathyarchaeia archaeon]
MSKTPKTLRDLPVTPFSYPTFGSIGKTGFWRTFKPTINYSKCTKCLLCWIYCPEGCIKRHADDTVEIDYEYCKGCGICAHECRVGAIKMEQEKKEM